jgi:hypothetical protein
MWNPPVALTPEKQKMAARTRKARRVFVLLRARRPELLDADVPHTLAKRSSPEPGGKAPGEAGVVALATLVQASCHVGDRDAVERTVMDKRWQLVLDGLGTAQSPCRQSTLWHLRLRLLAHERDKVLLERTVALAEQPGGCSARQRRVALDSTPLCGAGRVADTLTLLGHARRKAVGHGHRCHRGGRRAGIGASRKPGRRHWAWDWRKWTGGSHGGSRSSPSRRMSHPCRRCWTPSRRWSRRTPHQPLRGGLGAGASSHTSRRPAPRHRGPGQAPRPHEQRPNLQGLPGTRGAGLGQSRDERNGGPPGHRAGVCRPSENEAATSGNVALPIYKIITSSTMLLCATEAKMSVPQLIRWPIRWHVDTGTAYGTAFNPL